MNYQKNLGFIGFGLSTILLFQNCSKVNMTDLTTGNIDQKSEASQDSADLVVPCQGISCELTPLTNKPAVSTILLTLGDKSNSSLVINGASSQLIAETMIRSSSPVNNPKILAVFDNKNGGEDIEDISYVTDVLLSRYNVSVLHTSTLSANDVHGYDLIWYNNPGHPMGSKQTLETLLAFPGGIILQGDDLSRGVEDGKSFSLEALTGLKYLDNGTNVVCDGKSFGHDNNSGYKYRVSLDSSRIQGENASVLNFQYGNDIDRTSVLAPDLEVIATAVGGAENCTDQRPAIVRRYK